MDIEVFRDTSGRKVGINLDKVTYIRPDADSERVRIGLTSGGHIYLTVDSIYPMLEALGLSKEEV